MTFAAVDSVLQHWARRHGLPISTTYRDEEVRSVELTDQRGRRYQIWIDPPDESGGIKVHAWDYRKQRSDVTTNIGDLESQLDSVRVAVMGWMNAP